MHADECQLCVHAAGGFSDFFLLGRGEGGSPQVHMCLLLRTCSAAADESCSRKITITS